MQATLQAHRIETIVPQDGTLTLEHLPFPAGEAVEIIILPRSASPKQGNPYSLRSTRVRYDQPFEPVAADDWNAAP